MFLPSLTGVGELPLAQEECFSGYTLHGLDFFALILILPTLWKLDFGSSVQCFYVCLYLCFHQLLGKVSMVIFMIFICLTIGKLRLDSLSSIA